MDFFLIPTSNTFFRPDVLNKSKNKEANWQNLYVFAGGLRIMIAFSLHGIIDLLFYLL